MARHNTTFIVGSRRCGSSWIGKVFDAHPDTLYRFEPFQPGALLHPILDQLQSVNPLKKPFSESVKDLADGLDSLDVKCPWMDRYPLPLPQKMTSTHLVIKTVLMPEYAFILRNVGYTIGIIRNPYSQITSQLQTIKEQQNSCPHCLARQWLREADSMAYHCNVWARYEVIANDPQTAFGWLFDAAKIPMHEITTRFINETSKAKKNTGVPDRFGVNQDKDVPLNRHKDMSSEGHQMIYDVIKDTRWDKVYPCPTK